MTLKELPFGDMTFAEIIDKKFLYADKTRYIYELVKKPKNSVFLSRPRRFGKTLLLHTLSELFSGNKDRFKGLSIYDSDYTFPEHPVILLDLSYECFSPEALRNAILNDLTEIADSNKVKVTGQTPGVFFVNLIIALFEKKKSKVVVLIDEYDASVSKNMEDIELAKKNSAVLRDLIGTLKKVNVSPKLRFTIVTGITKHTLTASDSGPNHLVDISIDPKYAGICGFTLDEFDSLFADWMAPALESLIAQGKMNPNDNLGDLKERIFRWYDGYSWGGSSRVLNPYSLLNFFKNYRFENYWTVCGKPLYLTSLIKARPDDFLAPRLRSYLSEELSKSELTKLKAAPVLFHSGYLTLDEDKNYSPDSADNKDESPFDKVARMEHTYSFRPPNYEVSSSYYKDCFDIILDPSEQEKVKKIGADLKNAFLTKNAEKVSDIFRQFFTSITYFNRSNKEKICHAYVQMILMGMDFKPFSELLGIRQRLDLCFELKDKIYLLIEIKYIPFNSQLLKKEENHAIAVIASKKLSLEIIYESLAQGVMDKLDDADAIVEIFAKAPQSDLTESDKNKILAKVAYEKLTKEEREYVLAKTAREVLEPSEIEGALLSVTPKSELAPERIESRLTESANLALEIIAKKNYSNLLQKFRPKEIINLGLAVYGFGSEVKAIFR
jgi:hypothetical protein